MKDNDVINVLEDLWRYSKSEKYKDEEIRAALAYAIRTIARVHTILGLDSSCEELDKSPALAQCLEFESDKIREILKPKYEVIAYFKNGQCFAATGADAFVNDIELKIKNEIGNITAIINRAETLAITCNKIEEEAQ